MGHRHSSSLPPLPDLLSSAKQIFSGHFVLEWCQAPAVFCPDLDDLSDGERKLRLKYFSYALLFSFGCHSVVGIALTLVRNTMVSLQVSYKILPASIGDQNRSSLLDRLLRGRCFVGLVVLLWFVLYSFGLVYLLQHGAINRKQGIAWEAWVVWLNMHCTFGLFEVGLSFAQDGKRSILTYPVKMLTTLLPFLSEKFDSAKDVVFIAIAFDAGDMVLGCVCYVLLCASQVYFVWNPTTRAELLESYLPILVALPTQDSDSETTDMEGGVLQKLRQSIVQYGFTTLLKQTSTSRRKVTIFEDVPQGIAMAFFAWLHAGSAFVVVTLGISAIRIFLSSQAVGGTIHKALRDSLLEQRRDAARCNNAAKVLSLTRTIWDASEDDVPARELKDVGWTVFDLLAEELTPGEEFTAKRLRLAGFYVQEMMDVFSVSDLKDAGFTLGELKDAGFIAKALMEAGFAARELKEVGFYVFELKEAGFTAGLLKEAACTSGELKEAGFAGGELKEAGFTAGEIKEGGFTALQLKQAGFSAGELVEIGFTKREVAEAGFTAGELNEADFTAAELKEMAGSTAGELKELGFSFDMLRNAGYGGPQLREAGFPAREFKNHFVPLRKAGFEIGELKEAGFSVLDLSNEGWSAKELKEAGFTASEFLQSQPIFETARQKSAREDKLPKVLKEAGFGADELKKAGVNTAQLKQAGFTAGQLKQTGSTASELKDVGFKAGELRGERCGFSIKLLMEAGFTAGELKEADCSAIELADAGFTKVKLKKAGFSAGEIETAGRPFGKDW